MGWSWGSIRWISWKLMVIQQALVTWYAQNWCKAAARFWRYLFSSACWAAQRLLQWKSVATRHRSVGDCILSVLLLTEQLALSAPRKCSLHRAISLFPDMYTTLDTKGTFVWVPQLLSFAGFMYSQRPDADGRWEERTGHHCSSLVIWVAVALSWVSAVLMYSLIMILNLLPFYVMPWLQWNYPCVTPGTWAQHSDLSL